MLSKLLYKAGRIIIGGYARLMLKMDVHWHASLPRGPVLFAANHPSTTDPIFIHLITKQPMSDDPLQDIQSCCWALICAKCNRSK
jgi:1-acyl-sn-glycerol-3-phosphate acyltransferase